MQEGWQVWARHSGQAARNHSACNGQKGQVGRLVMFPVLLSATQSFPLAMLTDITPGASQGGGSGTELPGPKVEGPSLF